jgi:hypothetical protein
MVIFTPDQLALLQAALMPPMPPLVPSPQMAGTAAPPPPPPPAPNRTSVPLAAVSAMYLLLPLALAIASFAAPPLLRDTALALAPALALTLCLHALALPANPLAQWLGLLCAVGAPCACFAPQPWGPWAWALCLSAFFPYTLPRGPWRSAVLAGLLGVLLSGGLLLAGMPSRAAFGVGVASLTFQATGSMHRLARSSLRCSILE